MSRGRCSPRSELASRLGPLLGPAGSSVRWEIAREHQSRPSKASRREDWGLAAGDLGFDSAPSLAERGEREIPDRSPCDPRRGGSSHHSPRERDSSQRWRRPLSSEPSSRAWRAWRLHYPHKNRVDSQLQFAATDAGVSESPRGTATGGVLIVLRVLSTGRTNNICHSTRVQRGNLPDLMCRIALGGNSWAGKATTARFLDRSWSRNLAESGSLYVWWDERFRRSTTRPSVDRERSRASPACRTFPTRAGVGLPRPALRGYLEAD